MKRLIIALLLLGLTLGCLSCAPDAGEAGVTIAPDVTTALPETTQPPETEPPFPGEVRELIIGRSSGWPVPATLTIPAGHAPFPVVIFSHDVVGYDRDGTNGFHTPFADLADELAHYGIASIRYEHRVSTNAQKLVNLPPEQFTPETLSIGTIFDAVERLKREEMIDAGRIYVAGYGESGYLIPRIDGADTEGAIAGYIALGANAVASIKHVMRVQLNAVYRQTGNKDAIGEAGLAEMAAVVAAVEALTEENRLSGKPSIMGYRPAYWLSLRDYDAPEAAKQVAEPMLFLWGEYDSEVPSGDFTRWQEALAGESRAQFIRYPKLGHTFVEKGGPGAMGDYAQAGTVDRQVSADIAAFILGE